MEIENMDLDEIRLELEKVKATKDEASKYESRLKAEVVNRYRTELDAALAAKDDPFGTVNIGPVKFNVPKKVEWDQDKLAALYADIGESAAEYMDMTYKVKEAAFKNWPSVIQNAFLPARTVKAGTLTVEISDTNEERNAA